MIRRQICVFCGSRPGDDPRFAAATRDFGRRLAGGGRRLVYGGGSFGLMGTLADAVLDAGGEVTGVIPRFLATAEVAHPRVADMRLVGDMHERKALMAELSDAFVAMPGGFGTLEELFEAITWGQLKIHAKPVGILNVDGYFDALLAFLDRCFDDGFIKPKYRSLYVVASTPGDLLDAIDAVPSDTADPARGIEKI
ncbi:MAG: TIGR00730 family Rossman fold protein [Planctomycetota bacterium]